MEEVFVEIFGMVLDLDNIIITSLMLVYRRKLHSPVCGAGAAAQRGPARGQRVPAGPQGGGQDNGAHGRGSTHS